MALCDPGTIIMSYSDVSFAPFLWRSVFPQQSFTQSRKTPSLLMRCDKFDPSSSPDTVRWKLKAILGSLPLCHSPSSCQILSLSLSPSPLSLLRAAFLRRYLTVVVNNPCYGFQMSLRPTLELGIGLERGAGVTRWTLTVTGSAADWSWVCRMCCLLGLSLSSLVISPVQSHFLPRAEHDRFSISLSLLSLFLFLFFFVSHCFYPTVVLCP